MKLTQISTISTIKAIPASSMFSPDQLEELSAETNDVTWGTAHHTLVPTTHRMFDIVHGRDPHLDTALIELAALNVYIDLEN